MSLSELSIYSKASCSIENLNMIATVDIVAGLASHVLYFIRGEHHMSAPMLFYSYTGLAIAVFILELQRGDQTYFMAGRNTVIHIYLYALTLFTSIIIYRVRFHRLHSFPGPLLARVSKLWHVYHARHSLNHQLIQRLHDEYGSFVRTGRRNIHARIYVNRTHSIRPL